MKIDNIVNSTLKVVANENLNIEHDLAKEDSIKPLDQLLNEQKKEETKPNKTTNS
jgi:hypothetical protein